MLTFEEQQTFFSTHWDSLRQALETGGADAAISFAMHFNDELERRMIFMFGMQAILGLPAAGRNLDAYVAFARAGMDECLRQAQAQQDLSIRAIRTDNANVICYNLSAGLADCWVDGYPRERRHFELGLECAKRCVRWRIELNKGPAPFALAYWALGMHQLSLGRLEESAESFKTELAYSRLAAQEAGLGENVDSRGDFGVVLAAGYLGLARACAGQASGMDTYRQALAAFTAQLEDGTRREDAQCGIDQLHTVEQRYLKLDQAKQPSQPS